MYLIVGLGNPEKKYSDTRHNVGFRAIDFFIKENNLGKFKIQEKFKAEVLMANIENKKIIIAKPLTYMNNSGVAIQILVNYFKIQNENLIVVYDEMDLPIGDLRVKTEGSSAGHNGIKSIIEYLATDKFNRIRIGISNNNKKKMPADKFVLSRFSFFEKRKLKKDIFPKVIKEIFKALT